jgi:hypothetical protein
MVKDEENPGTEEHVPPDVVQEPSTLGNPCEPSTGAGAFVKHMPSTHIIPNVHVEPVLMAHEPVKMPLPPCAEQDAPYTLAVKKPFWYEPTA